MQHLTLIFADFIDDIDKIMPLKNISSLSELAITPSYEPDEMLKNWYKLKEFKQLKELAFYGDGNMDTTDTEFELNYLRGYLPNTQINFAGR